MMWFKRKPKPRVRLTCIDAGTFKMWSVWAWSGGYYGYWIYINGSADERAMRDLYAAHVKGMGDGKRIIVEQA